MPSNNACLLLLDLPPSAFCGIDLLSFTASPRFHGIKAIPPGWHFVFASATNSFSIRHGVWFKAAKSHGAAPDVCVKKWNAVDEDIIAGSEQEHLRWRANLGSVWREGLTPYRQSVEAAVAAEDTPSRAVEEKQDWLQLTGCISEELLSRILGPVTTGTNHWTLTSASSAKRDEDDIPGLSREESAVKLEKELLFLPIDLKRTWREGAVGQERTEAARDRTWALDNLLSKQRLGEESILGELQFTFLMVLTLNNNSCLEQWKRILGLLLTCTRAALNRPGLFVRFLALLKLQLEHCSDAEEELFDMADEAGNLMKVLLKRFRQGLEQQSGPAKSDVMDELDELEEFLRAKYNWLLGDAEVQRGMFDLEDGERVELDLKGADEEEEGGDYAPMIVDLTDAQAQELGLQSSAPLPDRLPIREKGLKDVISSSDDEDDRDLEDMDDRF